ncbi:hypothetical protein LINPERPRIM_LOCUS17283 [Linum perenne]
MSRKLPQLWAKKGVVRVSDVGFGFYIVNFETISDYDRAMFGGPWMVNDHYVVIQEWRPYFEPEETFLLTLHVWVRLPGIPFKYFDGAILKLIGDRIGKTVRIDHTTLEGSRGNFARICVEVDLSKPLLSKYRLRHQIRRIEYEGLHTICFNCGCYGHKDEACKQIPEADVTENQTTSFVNLVFQSAVEQDDHPEIDENFGPWMQVKRNRRKQKTMEAPAPATSASRPEESEAKKGNRFSIFADKETSDAEPQIPPQSKSLPLEFDVNEPLIEDLQEDDKENSDPESSGPPTFPQVAAPSSTPIGPELQISREPSLNRPAVYGPTPTLGVPPSPPPSQSMPTAQGPLAKLTPVISQQHESVKSSGVASSLSQKKSGAAPKGAKAPKIKSKGSAIASGVKLKDSSPLGGAYDGVSAMEEQ